MKTIRRGLGRLSPRPPYLLKPSRKSSRIHKQRRTWSPEPPVLTKMTKVVEESTGTGKNWLPLNHRIKKEIFRFRFQWNWETPREGGDYTGSLAQHLIAKLPEYPICPATVLRWIQRHPWITTKHNFSQFPRDRALHKEVRMEFTNGEVAGNGGREPSAGSDEPEEGRKANADVLNDAVQELRSTMSQFRSTMSQFQTTMSQFQSTMSQLQSVVATLVDSTKKPESPSGGVANGNNETEANCTRFSSQTLLESNSGQCEGSQGQPSRRNETVGGESGKGPSEVSGWVSALPLDAAVQSTNGIQPSSSRSTGIGVINGNETLGNSSRTGFQQPFNTNTSVNDYSSASIRGLIRKLGMSVDEEERNAIKEDLLLKLKARMLAKMLDDYRLCRPSTDSSSGDS